MDDRPTISSMQAIQDFRSARQKAIMREIMARLAGESRELLSYDEVRQKLKAQVGPKKELKEIPIKAIIGSVNRYQDFSRDFLPGQNVDEERWANVELATSGLVGLPPIEVYQIDEAYFVSDGNHRVSVAKQSGAEHIQAYVTELHARVPLDADARPEDIILKSEYTDFLEHTNLDQLRPGSDLSVTVPGQYLELEEHISVHRYFMGIDQKREIAYAEAVADWYDRVYLPVVEIIRQHGLLQDFPDRTETDLYLWIGDHRTALEDELDAQVEVSSAADDLAGQYSQRSYRIIARLGNKIVKTVVPNLLESGPAPGEWRQSLISGRRPDRLFTEILVPINGMQDGWCGLEQAIVLANREESHLVGLFIAESQTQQESQFSADLKSEFIHRCEIEGLRADFQVIVGDVGEIICERARWTDLVVLNLAYPPETSLLSRLSSGIRDLVQRCPRPILFTPQTVRALEHALLAYDGSLKAQEALFISTYLGGQWKIPLDVITIGEEQFVADIQGDARSYLEVHNVPANYITADGSRIDQIILGYVETLGVDLLVLGGYGRSPILELLQGSAVDEILQRSKVPMLICR